MDFFLERFFQASRARWWQVLAAVCIGATFAALAAWDAQPSVAHALRYAVGGAALGLLAAVFLLWVDAAQRMREAQQIARLTIRERLLAACIIFGFAMAGFSLLCAVLMLVVRTIEFLSKL